MKRRKTWDIQRIVFFTHTKYTKSIFHAKYLILSVTFYLVRDKNAFTGVTKLSYPSNAQFTRLTNKKLIGLKPRCHNLSKLSKEPRENARGVI